MQNISDYITLGLFSSISILTLYKYLKKPFFNKNDFDINEEKVVIIGAGISGICAAIKLQENGIPFEIYEKKGEFGGTWLDNIYPGSGCDVPSFLYSFSFAPNLSWSRKWATQEEIMKYLKYLAKTYKLYDNIHFYSEIEQATFNENTNKWIINIKNKPNDVITCKWLICSTGQLNYPNIPPIKGRELFKGESFHSARWNYNVDLTDKTVAVIGNGASAIQFVPRICNDVNKLFIFQRTPSYIDAKNDYKYPKWAHFMFKYIPFTALIYRWYLYISLELLWPFLKQGKMNKLLSNLFLKHMKKSIENKDLQDKILPNYLLGCKRVLISNDYIPAISQDNVNIICGSVDEINENSVISNNITYPVDIIIYGTGFKTSKFLYPIKIKGLNGILLDSIWGKYPHAFWGLTIPNIPNFFITYGPTTNLAHNSIIFMIECQCNYIINAIVQSKKQNIEYISLKSNTLTKYLSNVNNSVKQTVFATNCGSWYKTEDGELINNSPFSTIYYWWNTCFKITDYNIKKK